MDSYCVNFQNRFAVFFVISFLGGVLQLQANDNIDPSNILDKNTVMMIDVPNTEEFVLSAKRNFYDLVYYPEVEHKRLLPLNLSLLKRLPAVIKRKAQVHWLREAFKAIRTSTSDEISSIVESLSAIGELKNGSAYSPDQSSEIIESIAGLFPGRVFFAVEPKEKQLNYLFGFEYEASRFDWFEELKLTASDQAGEEETGIVEHDGQLEIYFLASDQIFFFEHNKTIYGIATKSLEHCLEFANRVFNGRREKDSLHGSRMFKRVKKSLGVHLTDSDCFCYVRLVNFERELGRSADNIRPLIWGDDWGFSLRWEENENYLSYRVASPMVFPIKKELTRVFSNALSTLDVDRARVLWPFEFFCYLHPDNFQDYPDCRHTLGSVKMDPINWYACFAEGARDDPRSESQSNYYLGMLAAFDSLRPENQESCSFSATCKSKNNKHSSNVYGSIIEDEDLSSWPKDEIGDVFDEVVDSKKFASSKQRMEVLALARQAAAQSQLGNATAGAVKPTKQPVVERKNTIVLDKTNDYLLTRKNQFSFYCMGASGRWCDQLADLDTGDSFVVSDWFGREVSDIDLTMLIVERNFCQSSYHCALRPIGIAMMEILHKSERQLYWSSKSEPENNKRFSFVTVIGQSIANEVQIDSYYRSFINGLSNENELPFYHAQVLGVNKNNDLNVVYSGLFRRTKK